MYNEEAELEPTLKEVNGHLCGNKESFKKVFAGIALPCAWIAVIMKHMADWKGNLIKPIRDMITKKRR